MLRRCDLHDFDAIHAIINDGAQAYKGVIPADRWTEPYMSAEHLQHEIDKGVIFWGYDDNGILAGVMGIQDVQDVTLIRHAYVRTANQKQGIGAHLLSHLRELTDRPVLHMGHQLLRKVRLPKSGPRRKSPPAQKILDHPRPPGRNLRSPRRRKVARIRQVKWY
jgi:N-acetylglutamate synthase-like GNAT family acetyltransferase